MEITQKPRHPSVSSVVATTSSAVSTTLGQAGRSWVWRGLRLSPVSAVRFVRAVSRRRYATASVALLDVGLGLVAWLIILAGTQVALNGALYPLLDAHDYQHSWGGPTLVGAWAVHAALAVPTVLGVIWLVRGLVVLSSHDQERSAAPRPHWWSRPLAVLLIAAGAALFVGWIHQL